MFEQIRQRIEKDLINEIECLDPVDLEIVGHKMISILEGKDLVHHGINKDHKPSGYTVDTFSSDSSIIAEYSTDRDYFSYYVTDRPNARYKKIHKDINHALNHIDPWAIEKIYLVCNHEEPPSFRQNFNHTDIFLNNREKIEIYDSRKIAKTIYQQSIENPSYADFYKDFFPDFSQKLDSWEYYGKIPVQCENFCSEQAVLEAIDNHYKKGNRLCVLHGISGSGKTQASIDYIHFRKNEYVNYIWITGEDWKKDTSLSAVQRTRGGVPINVAGIFNKLKTALVIDSIERSISEEMFKELEPGFQLGGIVLATSQIANPGKNYYLPMPQISENVALSILGEENLQSALTKKVIEKCRFSPLILSTIRKMVELEHIDRQDLYQEILDSPEDISGPDGASIIRKVLDRLNSKTLENLKKIANTGLTVFDLDFLRRFTTSLCCSKLQQFSILLPTNIPEVVKIHDLICTAMSDHPEHIEIVQKIEKYITDKKGEMTPSVLRQIHLAKELIWKYKGQHQELDWLTYALLQIECEEKYRLADKIFSMEFDENMPLSIIMCLIEAKELHSYKINKREVRGRYYSDCIGQYTKALELYIDVDIRAELLHHLGKTLRRNRNYEEAYMKFKQLLDLKPKQHAAYGQIITLGTLNVSEDLKEAGQKYMELLLTDMLNDSSKVPLRISLAAITKLRSYKNVVKKMINSKEKVQLIAQIAKNAALEDIGQFFEAFVAITSIFSYHYGQTCILLAESVPEMIMVTPDMTDDRQWINVCEALANLSAAAKAENKSELAKMLLNKSIEFADSAASKKHLNNYDIRAIAKSYIRNEMPRKALDLIETKSASPLDHWLLYRKAEAEMMLGKENAITTAKLAYDLLLKDKKNIGRQSSYLELISKCYEMNNNLANAVKMMEVAINNCHDKKYREQLRQRKRQLEKSLKISNPITENV